MEMWQEFTSNPGEIIFWHGLMAFLTGMVLYQGLVKGIEWASKWMLPLLIVLMVICAAWAISRPGGVDGLDFLFRIRPEYFAEPDTWMQGFTQMAWSTGAGWGLFLTYSTYFRNKDSLGTNAATVVLGDSTVAILAGMIVLPAVFSSAADPATIEAAFQQDNQGITFMVMPDMFNLMPFGRVFAILFFLAIVFAFLTCQFACFENPIKGLMDTGVGRKKSVVIVTVAVFLIGLPSAIRLDFLNNQDWVWGIGLMLVGALISWAIIKRGPEKIRNAVVNTERKNNIWIGKWWNVLVYIFPVMFAVLFVWWFKMGIDSYPGDWWNPLEVYSAGTMIVQWGIAIAVAILIGGILDKYTKPVSSVVEKDPHLQIYIEAWDDMKSHVRKTSYEMSIGK
jgi:NSS family neurotransmitter:Na+ symporter